MDPWRPNTPHSVYAPEREDTVLRPFKLIPGTITISGSSCTAYTDVFPPADGVHHYDEYGLRNISDEPPEIRQVHEEMVGFVLEWLKDWKPPAAT